MKAFLHRISACWSQNGASNIIKWPLRVVTVQECSLQYQILRRVPRWCSSIAFSSHPTQHSAIAVTVLIEMFLVYHKYPSTSTALLILFGFCTGYVVWWVAKLGCMSHCYLYICMYVWNWLKHVRRIHSSLVPAWRWVNILPMFRQWCSSLLQSEDSIYGHLWPGGSEWCNV